jgi:hypothetical protein
MTPDFHEIESALEVSYPPSFHRSIPSFSGYMAAASFERQFGSSRLLMTTTEIAAMRSSVPIDFLPFMIETHPSWPDVYGFDLTTAGPEHGVAVWSGHAFVADWPHFSAFFDWVRTRCTSSEDSFHNRPST